MASRRIRAFKRWMKSNAVDFTDALDFTDAPDEGVAVRALADLKEGDVVGKIPKSACLTVRTTGARDIIESAGLDGSLGLSVAIMFEISLGAASPWAGYLQVLPEKEDIPLVWSVGQVDSLLRGTELHKVVKEDKGLVVEDWEENISPLLDDLLSSGGASPRFFGVEQYFYARSLVASRSFEIDDFHGFGMVPLADMFNHKTGAEDVHFTSVASHSDSEDAETVSDVTSDDDDDDGDHKSESREAKSIVDVGNDSTVMEMIMVKDVKAGAEVFNTYGLQGNAALLHRYGFTEPTNLYDIVNIDMELVVQWSLESFSSRHSRSRLSLWRNLDFSSCTSQDSEYFEVSYNGEPQIELLVLLYILLLPDGVYHDLDLTVSTARTKNRSVGTIFSEKCRIATDESSEMCRDMLLTKGVRSGLLSLANKREALYGPNTLEDDMEALKACCPRQRKLYHSLMLRISERRILQRFRDLARAVMPSKKSSARKRFKKT